MVSAIAIWDSCDEITIATHQEGSIMYVLNSEKPRRKQHEMHLRFWQSCWYTTFRNHESQNLESATAT